MQDFYSWMFCHNNSIVQDEEKIVYRKHPDGSPCYAKDPKDCPVISQHMKADEADDLENNGEQTKNEAPSSQNTEGEHKEQNTSESNENGEQKRIDEKSPVLNSETGLFRGQEYHFNPADEKVEKFNPSDVYDIPDGLLDQFLNYCRDKKDDKFFLKDKASGNDYYASFGRRKGEITLQTSVPWTWGMNNTTRNLISWRPAKIERQPTVQGLLKKIKDPLENQLARYFGQLVKVNPSYATDPERLVDFLKGYNGERETSDAQVYGSELRDFFKKMRDTNRDSAVREMGDMMKRFHESPVAEAYKRGKVSNNHGRSLDLRGGAYGY